MSLVWTPTPPRSPGLWSPRAPAVLSEAVFDTTAAGLAQAHGWLVEQVGARSVLVVVEGTASCGAIVTVSTAYSSAMLTAPYTARCGD